MSCFVESLESGDDRLLYKLLSIFPNVVEAPSLDPMAIGIADKTANSMIPSSGDPPSREILIAWISTYLEIKPDHDGLLTTLILCAKPS